MSPEEKTRWRAELEKVPFGERFWANPWDLLYDPVLPLELLADPDAAWWREGVGKIVRLTYRAVEHELRIEGTLADSERLRCLAPSTTPARLIAALRELDEHPQSGRVDALERICAYGGGDIEVQVLEVSSLAGELLSRVVD